MCGFIIARQCVPAEATSSVARRGPDLQVHCSYRGFEISHFLLSLAQEFRPQPMISASGDILCVYNGEIYNSNQFGAAAADGDCLIPLYQKHGPEFARLLDGEFAIALIDYRTKQLITCTDTFSTKPLWLGESEFGLAVCSYASPLEALRCSHVRKQQANQILVHDLSTSERLATLAMRRFSLDQHKETYDDWCATFMRAVRKRTNRPGSTFIPLSSGYDSGGIAAVAIADGSDCRQISWLGSENEELLRARHALTSNAKLIRKTHQLIESTIQHLKSHVENFTYQIVREGVIAEGESLATDPGTLGLALVCEQAAQDNLKICLSGQGADEILSDYGIGGRKLLPHSNFGGHFPERLEDIFPWPSFYESTQYSYLGKEECVLGCYGMEGRYPYLDAELVQEFLWLNVDLKNARYKAPLAEFLERMNYPFEIGRKIGFGL